MNFWGIAARQISETRLARLALVLLALGVSAACQSGDKGKDDGSQTALDSAVEEQARKEAAEEAERQRLAKETAAKRAADEAEQKDAAKSARDQLVSCCENLGKLGFENRSMDYMKGYDVCEAAKGQDKTLPDIVDAVRAAIGKNALPEFCTVK